MRQLYTLAYPVIAAADRAVIDDFRRTHDATRHAMVEPHFTLVFSCDALPEGEYVDHVAKVAVTGAPIDFVCRYATVGTDHRTSSALVFLVPDEGSADLSRLHDQLYAGPFAPHRRLDIPFVPHITIGTVDNHQHAKVLSDVLNAQGVMLAGRIDALSVAAMDGDTIVNLATCQLRRQSR